VQGFDHLFGLGNVLTGKGNIKESRKSSTLVSGHVLRYLGLHEEFANEPDEEVISELSVDSAVAATDEVVTKALAEITQQKPLAPAALERVQRAVEALWQRSGYPGDYATWIDAVRVSAQEA
jgi:hypothetical protein